MRVSCGVGPVPEPPNAARWAPFTAFLCPSGQNRSGVARKTAPRAVCAPGTAFFFTLRRRVEIHGAELASLRSLYPPVQSGPVRQLVPAVPAAADLGGCQDAAPAHAGAQ